MDGEDYPCYPLAQTGFRCDTEHGLSVSTVSTVSDFAGTPTPADNVLFKVQAHLSETFSSMFALFQAQKLTDIALKVGCEKIHCHKIVLASSSPYFRAMFTSGLKESDMQEITLHGVKAPVLAALVNFIYTGEIRLSPRNVCDLLPAATMLQLRCVVDACCEFLRQQLHPTNCIGIHVFAHAHATTSLTADVDLYIQQHFTEIINHEEFLDLSSSGLAKILQCDQLNIRSEAEVFHALVRWIHHNETGRDQLLPELLPLIRCFSLSPDFIGHQLRNNSLISGCQPAASYLQSVYDQLINHKHVELHRRKSPLKTVIYSAGGYYRYSLKSFEYMDLDSMEWTRLPELAHPRSGLSAVSLRGCVYLVGGRNNNESGNIDAACLDMFDPSVNSWHRCSLMSVPRNRVAVGIIDDKIYAIGGSSISQHHNTAEKYDPDSDQWLPIAPMRQARIGLGVATVDRLLYAVGGYDGFQRLSSVERYWPEEDRWETVASMNQPRSGAGVVALGKYIYAVGGYDSMNQLRTVERFDTEANVWEFVSPMIKPRSALAATVVDERIWVFGGYDGYEFLSSIEIYNPTVDAWAEVGSMNCGKSGHGVCLCVLPAVS